jgi:hypothetical protein
MKKFLTDTLTLILVKMTVTFNAVPLALPSHYRFWVSVTDRDRFYERYHTVTNRY